MGRITVNGTQAGFSCKLNIDPALWDEKTNYLKSQRNTLSREIHQMLENIKAQIAKHYQSISDRDAYVTANKVKNAYHGFGDRYKTLIAVFDYHADSIKARIGRDRAQRTYDRLMEERGHCGKTTALKRTQTLKCVLYVAVEQGWSNPGIYVRSLREALSHSPCNPSRHARPRSRSDPYNRAKR